MLINCLILITRTSKNYSEILTTSSCLKKMTYRSCKSESTENQKHTISQCWARRRELFDPSKHQHHWMSSLLQIPLGLYLLPQLVCYLCQRYFLLLRSLWHLLQPSLCQFHDQWRLLQSQIQLILSLLALHNQLNQLHCQLHQSCLSLSRLKEILILPDQWLESLRPLRNARIPAEPTDLKVSIPSISVHAKRLPVVHLLFHFFLLPAVCPSRSIASWHMESMIQTP